VKGAALDGLEEQARIDAEPFGQRDRLRAGFHYGQHPAVGHDLQQRSGTGLTGADGALPDGVEDGLDPRSGLFRAGFQDYELALLRGLPGAENRRVDEPDPVGVRQVEAAVGARLADGRHLQPDGVRVGGSVEGGQLPFADWWPSRFPSDGSWPVRPPGYP